MDVNTRMVKVNVTLIVLLLLFVAVVAIRAVIDSDMTWRYDKVFKDKGTGQLSDMIATADDDIWVVGNATRTVSYAGDESADDGFLLHHDGTRWQRRPMPTLFGDSVYEARFDDVDSGGFLLTASLKDQNSPRTARWDGTRWTALPKLPDDHRAADVRAFAADDIWVLDGRTGAQHWDGTRWTAMDLPVTVTALDGVASDDLWAVGSRSTNDVDTGREGEFTQPAAVHWDGRAWKHVRMPDYHFPAPAPPEPSASLSEVVALAKDDVRAYGEHSYNHGEEYNEPPEEDIRLRWNGTRWTKPPNAKSACADRGRAVRDGKRGIVLSASQYLTADGDCEGISYAELPSTDGIRSSSQQSLWLNAIEAVPGTDKILGVGHVEVNQAGNPTSRSVIVILQR
ncbi:hypothetical protein OG905_01950 [Streptomyces sp. NBC_00322]|uniref:hypothetical protein n=1 Tax=Streptomyces sp. NBC_00322 TaxID=2975712 RepID=UPI002E2D50AF|nr:hypothetical protein [Streptomyces sp. NBC_00322]